MRSYLTNRLQRCKTHFLSEWEKVLAGATQGSILGPRLFNILKKDIFLFLQE